MKGEVTQSEQKKSVLGIVQDIANSPGAAPLWAAGRAGLKDLQGVALKPFPDSMPTVSEPGSMANPTSQLVTQELTGQGVDNKRDLIHEIEEPAKQREEPNKDEPEMEL